MLQVYYKYAVYMNNVHQKVYSNNCKTVKIYLFMNI